MRGELTPPQPLASTDEGFPLAGKPRVIARVKAVPFRWPTKPFLAEELITEWACVGGVILGSMKLSKITFDVIVSHMSRRDGALKLSNQSLSLRTSRSLRSTERDVSRYRDLGLILISSGDSGRLIRPAWPANVSRWGTANVSLKFVAIRPPTFGGYVGGHDMGGRRDV